MCCNARALCADSHSGREQPHLGSQRPLQAGRVRRREKGDQEERKNLGPQLGPEQRAARRRREVSPNTLIQATVKIRSLRPFILPSLTDQNQGGVVFYHFENVLPFDIKYIHFFTWKKQEFTIFFNRGS